MSYAELCLRSDSFTHPGRSHRAVVVRARIEELAPPGSAERDGSTTRRAGPGALLGRPGGRRRPGGYGRRPSRSRACRSPRRCGEPPAARPPPTTGGDLRAAEPAAAVELLQGRSNALLRLLLAHRVAAYVLTFAFSFGLDKALVLSGTLDFSLWGRLFRIPVFVAEGRLREARRLGRERVVARIRERHERTAQGGSAGASTA
ncbi:hypothetical protein ACFXGI_07360 [Streptomyces sp. NPDC059355]|uniref:hypothetical protein n=1 Tax=Streptomyces sp. NPDC059355 TaxID=3346811 RepID=UPI0036CFE22A